jgi:molybdopterin molybdotransferase
MPSPEFFRVQPVEDALQLLFDNWQPEPRVEKLDTYSAVNRIIAQDIHSPMQVPPFRKSTVDGYAVRASDTFGASQSLPAYLKVIGEVPMGEAPTAIIGQGEAIQIHTGGMLPDSANAVVMVEYTQAIDDTEIEVLKASAPGENIIQIGEDVQEGDVILHQYHRIRPQDIGGLLAVGVTEIDVIRRPRVGILSCGDELIEPEKTPVLGQIRDINAYTLSALVENTGGKPVHLGIAPDTLAGYTQYAEKGFSQTDMLILTAGSSVSARDYTRDVINRLGQPGVLQHGLATKPGKPTILAVCDGKPVIGLPGNPVSALLVARQILPELIARYTQQSVLKPQTTQATLSVNIASVTGREDWIAVRLTDDNNGHRVVEPIFGKSNLIYILIQADGLIQIPINTGGLKAGTLVDVIPF